LLLAFGNVEKPRSSYSNADRSQTIVAKAEKIDVPPLDTTPAYLVPLRTAQLAWSASMFLVPSGKAGKKRSPEPFLQACNMCFSPARRQGKMGTCELGPGLDFRRLPAATPQIVHVHFRFVLVTVINLALLNIDRQ
jgi:hypothetical protein